MAAEKSERLLNLLIMLLMQRRYIAKDRVRVTNISGKPRTPTPKAGAQRRAA